MLRPTLSFCFALLFVLQFTFLSQTGVADTITTTFAGGNGQAGNMFDINVIAADGIEITEFELNLDPGSWDLELYTRDGSYVGNETDSGAWTLVDSTAGLTSAGENVATSWDTSDLTLTAGAQAFYVSVTNGSSINYTNGGTEGDLYASNSDIEIYEGTGNAANFGGQFRPRVWNGSIIYNLIAVPEPSVTLLFAGGMILLTTKRSRCSTANVALEN